MADFIDIHTHSVRENCRQVLNRRLGMESTEGIFGPCSVGIHPWDAEVFYPTLSELLEQLEIADCVAIGEIGLDKVCKADFGIQQDVFKTQLSVAEGRKLPVVIHCVRAQQEVVKMLAKHDLPSVIFHGFIGSPKQVAELIKSGWFISFGVNALRSPKTIEALRIVPLENMLLESDTDERPIEKLYAEIAQIKEVELEHLKTEIEKNYNKIFR